MTDFIKQSEIQAKELLQQFMQQHRIDPEQEPIALLHQVTSAFAQLPYENLSKILRDHETNNISGARRLPGEVLQEHYRLGTGGTCYSLTWTLLQLVKALGFEAEPILADRRYGPNTHSALVVWIHGVKHLLDPGYLLVEPIPFPYQESLIVPTSFHEVKLQTDGVSNQVKLQTIMQNQETYRLTYKTDPIDIAQFLAAWDESFTFDMMKYPVLSRIINGQQLYLQKNHLLIRSRVETHRLEIEPANMPQIIEQKFGVSPQVASDALNLLHRKEG